MRSAAPVVLAVALFAPACGPVPGPDLAPAPASAEGLAERVEVVRTAYGVPHIYADDFRALGYALGYLQLEDYGERVPLALLRARGELAQQVGREALQSDVDNIPYYRRAVAVYGRLRQDTRDVYEGFAAGVNRYIAQHPGEFPPWMRPLFTGYDVAAIYLYRPIGLARRWTQRLAAPAGEGADSRSATARLDGLRAEPGDAGSSSWALAPSRTISGAPILLRNPHLSWQAGYWEAHVVVPGRLDFYGDFRIGAPLGIVGGFNRHLAFSTSNNDVNNVEVYALDLDPADPERYLIDGVSRPIGRETIAVSYRDGAELATEHRERLVTDLGRVLHRDDRRLYVLTSPEEGEFRAAEQFLALIQARSLDEWRDALRIAAHPDSNFTYADAAGNIFYIWNGVVPVRPDGSDGTEAVPVSRRSQLWQRVHPLEDLPQLLNPPGGYVRNENDGPWLTNLRQPLSPLAFPSYFERSEVLSLRSQHSLALLDGDARVSLEDVVQRKHSTRMLLADRVKADLLAAVRPRVTGPGTDDTLRRGVDLLERWDHAASADSRGAVLFAEWWRTYVEAIGPEAEPFAQPWTVDAPVATPHGLARPDLAADTFAGAVRWMVERFGAVDVPWGDVHRIRRGAVDEPASGCPGQLGCFRVLNFTDDPDGRRSAVGGDGWVLAVELTNPPRAYSVLAYGQSAKSDSPHHADQAAMFARGGMKRVAYLREDVERQAVRRYRPGLE